MIIVLICIAIIIAVVILAFIGIYLSRLRSIKSIGKLTDCEDGFDLYKIDIKYDYKLDKMLSREYPDDKAVSDAILGTALPLLPIRMKSPDYSCSAFGVTDKNGNVLMGRNYDFEIDTSALLVHCSPENGYSSVGMAALDHVCVSSFSGIVDRLSALPAPLICLDGMNEKGVSVAVLMLDSETTNQKTKKPDIFTTLAIRLILDRAASTQEAVDLLRGYDMFAVSGLDYHFYVTDASGDGRIIEYDCHSETRDIVDTPVRTATNFYEIYKDKVLPNRYNGIYGHGRERYDRIEEVLTANEGVCTKEIAFEALRAAEQLPNPREKTSNTQWSVVYDDTKLTSDVVIRRHWGEITSYSLPDNTINTKSKNDDIRRYHKHKK